MPERAKPSGEPSFTDTNPFEATPVDSVDIPLQDNDDFDDFLDDAEPKATSSTSLAEAVSGTRSAPDDGDDFDFDDNDDTELESIGFSGSLGSASHASGADIARGCLIEALENPKVTEISLDAHDEMFVRIGGENIRVKEFDAGTTEDYHSILNEVLIGRAKEHSRPIANDFLVELQLPLRYEGIGASTARVHILTPPITREAVVTIAKRPPKLITLSDMVAGGTMTSHMAQFLIDMVKAHKTMIVSGGTGAGKTTLLSALGSAGFRNDEKLVVIEDLPELDFGKEFSVYLHTTPEKPGIDPDKVTMDYLVRQTKRMRVARVVIGEVRGPEIKSFLDVAKSGVPGSMNTLHSDSAQESLTTIEQLASSDGTTSDSAMGIIKQSIASAIDFVVQAKREEGKERNRHLITEISEVSNSIQAGKIGLTPIFKYLEDRDSFVMLNPPSDRIKDTMVAMNLPSRKLWGL